MFLRIFLIAALIVSAFQSATFAQSTPQVMKQSLFVRTYRDTMFWKQPNIENNWSWMAGLEFDATGTIPDASFINVEFTMPDGKPWYAVDITAPTLAAGKVAHIETPAPPTHLDKRNILDTGVFGFKISLKNGLSGTNQELYKGRFTVKKFHVGNNLPAFKNQFEYYVDQDWTLPIGYLWAKEDASAIGAAMWFRGENVDKLEGYLFYNGKQIGSTKSSGAAMSDKKLLTSGNDTEPRWERWIFAFYGIAASAAGNYEVKVLRDGKLSRTASFAVGTDGKIVDNRIAAQNAFYGAGTILPIKILDAKAAPAYNPNAYKTEAFYTNPLAGFTAQ